jgi:hypothetical protein
MAAAVRLWRRSGGTRDRIAQEARIAGWPARGLTASHDVAKQYGALGRSRWQRECDVGGGLVPANWRKVEHNECPVTTTSPAMSAVVVALARAGAPRAD